MTLALAVLAALVAIAPLLLGGAYPWGMLIIAGLAVIALAVAVWVNQSRTRVQGLLWTVMVLAFAWTVVQAMPLPCALVRVISPESARQLERVHQLLESGAPRICMLSRDPAATRQEIVKGIAILCAFAATVLLVQLGQRRGVLRALAGTGALLAVVSLAHAATGATRVFGIYTPVDVHGLPFLAPLLNMNTLGGVLAACWPLAAAFAITTRTTGLRLFWLGAATAIAATTLMTGSRGGVGAFLLGLIAFALLGLRARMRSGQPARDLRASIGIGLAIVVATGLTVYGAYEPVALEFETGGWDKLRLIAAAWSYSLAHPWIGIGRGAFSAVFAGAELNVVSRFEYPENFVVQWAAEWGLPLTALLLAVLGWALAAAVVQTKSWERSAAVAGCVALAAQNLVDLGSELVGVAVLAAVMFGAAVCERDGELRPQPNPDPHPWRSPLVALAAVGAVAAACLAPGLLRDDLASIQTRLRAAAAGNARAEFHAALARAMEVHPSEPNLAILAADEALEHADRAAGRFINRALELAPSWSAPHAQATLWLWNGGHRRQALLELASTVRADVHGSRPLVCLIARSWPAGVVSIAEQTGQPALFLELAANCLDMSDSGRDLVDLAVLRYAPNSVPARTRQAERAMASGQFEQALQRAREVLTIDPSALKAAQIELAALQRLERTSDALVAVRRALRALPRAVQLRDAEVQLLLKTGDHAALARALAELRANANDAQELAHAYFVAGQAESAEGNPSAALRAFQQAYDVAAEPGSLRAVASLARSLGDVGRARRAYAQLCAINPADSESCTAATTSLPRPAEGPASSASLQP